MNFIFESSSVLKDVCMLLAPAHYVVDKYGAHGRLYTYYDVKLFQILRRTLKLVGDVFFFMLLLHSMAVEVIIVRIVVISEFKSDKCDLWDKQYVRIQGQWSYHGWWMLMQKVKKEMTTTPLHTSSLFFTDETWFSSLEFSDTRWEW